MEADWAVEIGSELPVIDALWPGFIDLAAAPDRIVEIEEAQQFSPLADVLLQINQPAGSDAGKNPFRFWTAKCDLWEPEDWDPYEMSASQLHADTALACYIDILPGGSAKFPHALFSEWQHAERCARELVLALRKKELASSRIDCIVRSARAGELEGFGITAYVTACGAGKDAAASALANALRVFTGALAVTDEHDSMKNLLPLQ